jgi:DNA-binding CsgD family transcriptional regulator
MSAVLKPMPGVPLRVTIHAATSSRRLALSKILVDAGYIVVEAQGIADVALIDGDCAQAEDRPTVVLGGGDHPVLGSLSPGADAYQIDAALRAVAAGLVVRSPAPKEAGFDLLDESDVQGLLTPRELEVLGAIMGGFTNKTIARQLDISLHTVKFHVESLFRKLGVRTRAEAVAKALDSSHFRTINL